MARTSTASSRTAKATSASKTAARKSTGAARKSSGAASRATGTAKKSASSAAKKSSGTARKASDSAKKTTGAAKRSATGAAKKATGTARKAAGTAKKAATTTARKAANATTKSSASARKSTASKSRGSSTRSSRPDALQVLIEDHNTVEALFKRFEKSSSGAKQARGEIAGRVIEELSVHAVIEEQAFYPAVRQVKGLEDEVLEALEEHHVVKWVLSELEKMNPDDERFEAKFTVMMENVRHHVEEEESDMFKKVRRAMSRDQLEALGAALQEAKTTAPTRPHPRTPDTPPGNMIAGAIAAPLDAALTAGANAVDSVRKLASRATGNG